MKRYDGEAELFLNGTSLQAATASTPWTSDTDQVLAEMTVTLDLIRKDVQPPHLRVVRAEIPSEVRAMLMSALPIIQPDTAHAFIGATLDGIQLTTDDELPARSIRWTFADGSARIDRLT